MTTALSPSAARVLAAIVAFWDEHHYSPSVREVTALAGFRAASNVNAYVHHLRRLGYITFDDGITRSIVVVRRNP